MAAREEKPEQGGERDPRIYMAAERTLLAWIRTGLAMMGFGFVVARFGLFLREIALARGVAPAPTHGISLWAGTALVALGVFVNAASAVDYTATVRRLKRGAAWETGPSRLGLITSSLLAAIGIGMITYLLAASR